MQTPTGQLLAAMQVNLYELHTTHIPSEYICYTK